MTIEQMGQYESDIIAESTKQAEINLEKMKLTCDKLKEHFDIVGDTDNFYAMTTMRHALNMVKIGGVK